MLHLPHVSGRLIGTPLMIHGGKLQAIISGLAPRLGLQSPLRPMAFDDDYPPARPQRRPYDVTASGVAVIPVVGLLVNRSGTMDAVSTPLCSYEQVLGLTAQALADPNVRGVVHDYESPGGEALGCIDAARTMAAMRRPGGKPIIAVANAYAYSAAYALASAADLIFVPASGQVGSVGVVAVHADESGADAKEGIAWEYIYQGARKVDGNSHAPLSGEARAGIEAEVAHLYGLFVGMVAVNRRIAVGAVRGTEAACLNAPDAIKAGLADRIGGLADAVAEAGRRASQLSGAGRSAARTTSSKEPTMPGTGLAASDAHTALRKEVPAAALEGPAGIVQLCTMAGRPQDAAGHIAAGRSRGEVALALLRAGGAGPSQASTSISTAHTVGSHTPDPADPHGWAASARRVFGTNKGA